MYKKYQKAGPNDPSTNITTNLAPDPVIGNQMNLGMDFECDTSTGANCSNKLGRPFRLGLKGSLMGSKGAYGQPTNLGPGWDPISGQQVDNRIGTNYDNDITGNLGAYLRTDLQPLLFPNDASKLRGTNWEPWHLDLGYNRKQNLLGTNMGTGSNNITAKLAKTRDQKYGSPGYGGLFGNKGGSSKSGYSYGLQGNYNYDTKQVDNIGAFGRIGMMGPLGVSGYAGINPQTGKPNFGAGMSVKFKKGGVRKYQTAGQNEVSEKQYFANYLKEAEATDAYMKTYPSLVKKPGGGYYMALEDGIYYPYNDDKGNQTIGYGRHNNTILKDYPKGISVDQANEFLFEDIDKKYAIAKDQYDTGYVGKGINFKGFGKGEFDKLSEREQYMVTNFLYNPGHIYPMFSGALRDKDTKVAGEEYNVYMVTNKGEKNEKRQSLGRNAIFNRLFVEPWQDKINNPVEEPVESTKETTTKGPYSSVGKKGWFGLPDMGITEALFGFQRGGQRQMGGTMMSNPSMYNRMEQLPGGVMQQIPGSDAVEFKGQTHKQGGILMDPETEVEDGETMDKVTMKDGENKDYFFSSYLKKNGQSYADMHKEILSRGGSQKDINYLAAMQEKAAKRNPNKIAKLGGIAMYAEGGAKDDVSKKEKKAFQKERYKYYEGPLSFKKWNKENPFDLKAYLYYNNPDVYFYNDDDELVNRQDETYAENHPTVETIGLRQDLVKAYGYRADMGDGYTICQSGNCQDGTGVMYTYFKENLDENSNPVNADGTVIGMYEGEFKDGKPVGQGKFTWNDIDASLSDGVPFVPWSYSMEGEFTIDNTGHPELVYGTRDYGDLQGVSIGTFKDGEFVSGTKTVKGKLVNIEDGEETKKFSKDVRKDLVEKGLLEKIPFKYSQGDINPVYSKMKDHSSYTQPTETELNALGYNSFDEFRADYERLIDASYDWKNVTDWGKKHEDALGEIKNAIENNSFTTTGTFTAPVADTDEPLALDPRGPVILCPCNPQYTNYNVPEGVDCTECKEDIEKEEDDTRKGMFGFKDNTVPGLAIASGLAQTIPAIYAMTHNQPDPDMLPFESGVTSPIVPGRLRAKKLSHINMNQQRSANDANLREMNQFIDTSGGGPATMINRMAAWSRKHEGDMQIAAAEKQANIGIENQNTAIENQTNLHNLKMEQEAALGNAQMQMSEAQRLNEVNAINTAAKNKIKDDEEYMKYAGVISAAQGVGSMFSDMLAYKGDMLRAQGYSIDGTTNRMLLRRQIGKTMYNPIDGSVFCDPCTNADIARYEKTFTSNQSPLF